MVLIKLNNGGKFYMHNMNDMMYQQAGPNHMPQYEGQNMSHHMNPSHVSNEGPNMSHHINQNNIPHQPGQNLPPYMGQHHMNQAPIVDTIQNCEAVCEYTEYYVTQMAGASQRIEQQRLLRDCADICALTAKYLARCSVFSKHLAALCAQICEVCGCHCLQHPDEQSQLCGQVCLHCAQECKAFAMSA